MCAGCVGCSPDRAEPQQVSAPAVSAPAQSAPVQTAGPFITPAPTPAADVTPSPHPSAAVTSGSAKAAADAALEALKNKKWDTFAKFVHPQKGVRFSPYAHIDIQNGQTFQASALPSPAGGKTYMWGIQEGSGEPIQLTFEAYFRRFVYDKDFAAAKQVGTDSIVGKSSIIVNIKDIYPGSVTVDYHFPEFDPKYGGMDWESLILVLEKYEGSWYVCAVVHSQWTP